jgi:hypothetical protein
MATITKSPTEARKFSIPDFCKRYHLVRSDITRMTQYSPRAVAKWVAGDKPSAAAEKQLKELVRLFDALSEVMETSYIGEWLKAANPAFDNSTPLQVIERGETDRIWHMIYRLQTGEPT